MTSISVVVTAPHGIADCPYLDDLLSTADGQTLEVVAVDGSPAYADQSRVGLRHVRVETSDCGVQALITEGIRHATLEWVVVIEDHCRPLPGFLEAYRRAIGAKPEVDLFAGAVDNLTSTSAWSSAFFMSGLRNQWTQAPRPPAVASNANLMVRRSAILPSELSHAGGFLNLTVPRIVRSGRFSSCPEAVVDHVLEFTCWQAVSGQFGCTSAVVAARREALPSQSVVAHLVDDCRELAILTAVAPVHVAWNFRKTNQSGALAALRLMLMGITVGAATFAADLRRLKRRPDRSAQ